MLFTIHSFFIAISKGKLANEGCLSGVGGNWSSQVNTLRSSFFGKVVVSAGFLAQVGSVAEESEALGSTAVTFNSSYKGKKHSY